MSSTTSNSQIDQGDLFGAALRYCAVADWFESHPCAWRKHLSVNQAMEIFNRAEADLRAAGRKALRQRGNKDLILQAAGVPAGAR